MIAYIWPIALVVISNILYHICAKSIPENVNPFLSLLMTYIVGAICTFVLYLITGKETTVVKEVAKMNWAPYVLGFAIIGLELGNIYAYKAGWEIGIEAIVQSSFLAVGLIFVGYLIFHETITWNKVAGIIICLAGLAVINLK